MKWEEVQNKLLGLCRWSVHLGANQGSVYSDHLPGLLSTPLASEGTETRFWVCVGRGGGGAPSLDRVCGDSLGPSTLGFPLTLERCSVSWGLRKIILSCPAVLREAAHARQPCLPPTPHNPALAPTQPLYLTLSRGLRRACLPDSHGRRQGAAGQGCNHLALGIQQQLGRHSLDLQALGWCWGCHASRVHYPRKGSNNLRGNNAGTPGVRPVSSPAPNPKPHTGRGRDLNHCTLLELSFLISKDKDSSSRSCFLCSISRAVVGQE